MAKRWILTALLCLLAAQLSAESVRTLAAVCGSGGPMLEYRSGGDSLTLSKAGPFVLLDWDIRGDSGRILFTRARPSKGDMVAVLLGRETACSVNGITVERSPLRVPLPGTGLWQGRGALWTRLLDSRELREYAAGKRVYGALAVNETNKETGDMNCSLNVYDRAKYMLPIWSSGVIYHETVMFVEGDRRASLALPAAEIYEVRSSDLRTVFVPGRDYTLEDGDLALTEGSAIPVMSLAEYYPDPASAEPGTYFESTVEGHPLLGFSETPKFIERQIAVTYRPAAKWQGPVPRCQPKFDRFLTKLFSGEPVTVVYYGDSISTGANSSSIYGRSPNAENWCRMSCSVMEDISGNKNVKYVNTAVGGMESLWAVDNIEERVIACKPDLLVYAFGMNDHAKPAEEFIRLTDLSVQKVQAACPDCDILLVSTMLPHKRARGFWNNQDVYEAAMEDYVRGREHVGLAPVTSIHRYLLTRKEYYHATGNNVNHPNDFLARIYAQTVIKVIFDR